METTDITRSIDARGMPCPGPLMSLIGAIREGTVGDTIEVLSSDEGSHFVIRKVR
jgi:tRNA 2-thiouridine synthesizing protein A